jgi:hypothetical protein
MKSDDPRLQQAKKDMRDRIEKMDKLTLTTLRAHLAAEQSMNDFMLASGVGRSWIKRKKFKEKFNKCKALAKEEANDALWDVLGAANDLRNTIWPIRFPPTKSHRRSPS